MFVALVSQREKGALGRDEEGKEFREWRWRNFCWIIYGDGRPYNEPSGRRALGLPVLHS